MTTADDPAPRGATPNWQPATTLDDYLRNGREELEKYSDRRAAKAARLVADQGFAPS